MSVLSLVDRSKTVKGIEGAGALPALSTLISLCPPLWPTETVQQREAFEEEEEEDA